MARMRWAWGLGGCLAACSLVGGQERNGGLEQGLPARERANTVYTAQVQTPGKKEEKKKDDKTQPPQIDLSAVAPQTSESSTGFSPQMMGDIFPLVNLVIVKVPSFAQFTITIPPKPPSNTPQIVNVKVPVVGTRQILVPIGGRGGFKIGENQTVMPQSGVSFSYNYYDNVQPPAHGSDRPMVVPGTVIFQGQPVAAQITIPGVTPPRIDAHRETLGFEKTFLDDRFSVGVRLPLFQNNGADAFSDSDLGDVTTFIKAALWHDGTTGSGICAGVAVTAPNGPDVQTADGTFHSTLIQPFLGYQWNSSSLLVYGFTSVAVPTDKRDVTLLFNDIGIGLRAFEGNGLLRTVIPAVEAHVTTPLDHRQPDATVQAGDWVVLTGGVHLGIGQRSLLTLGVATPVTGPRPCNVEALVQFNFRF